MSLQPNSAIEIHEVSEQHMPILRAHLARHFAESGRNGFHFMPYAPSDPKGPMGVDAQRIQYPLDTPNWERWFMAFDTQRGEACGHVDLKGYSLRASAHRCVLGIGIEEHCRGMGLGKRLMETAIDFVRQTGTIDWLDLMVFAHNTSARALYSSLGFVESGYNQDMFRIDETSIDDVSMSLRVNKLN